MEPLIRMENITRSFKVGSEVIHAVNNISLTIEPNSFTLLQGPSGSGKTTLLNLIGALDYPTSGKVFFEGDADRRDCARDVRLRRLAFAHGDNFMLATFQAQSIFVDGSFQIPLLFGTTRITRPCGVSTRQISRNWSLGLSTISRL